VTDEDRVRVLAAFLQKTRRNPQPDSRGHENDDQISGKICFAE
jgi:hypothetical protein